MLTLTRRTDYALVALTHLARCQDRVSSAREIAELHRVPLPILMNILKTLAQHDMVTSIRGARGGYKLAADAREISLHMVVKALEGPVHLFQCSQGAEPGAGTGCERQGSCPFTATARKVSSRLQQFLDEVTVAELAEECVATAAPPSVKT